MSGIYQSRLFNFLNRQKIRLGTKLGITFRHLQLATETGVKTLLYPVYVIAKIGFPFRRQLKSNSQSARTPDKISGEGIVTENDLWLEDGETTDLTTIRQTRQDRSDAIAPIRFFQKMWNKLKTNPLAGSSQDLKSTPEQESFPELISRAIAYFFGNKQQLLSSNNQEALPSAQDSEVGTIQLTDVNLTVVKDSRSPESKLTLFSKVGGWLEKVKTTITRSHDPAIASTEEDSLQSLISRAIAYFFGNKQQLLSSNNQEALPSAQDSEAGTIQLTDVNLTVVKDSRSPESKLTLFSKVGGWLEKVKTNITRSHDPAIVSTEEESLAIQVLIRRAIAYFFGNKQQLLSSNNQEALPSSHPFNNYFSLPFSNSDLFLVPTTFTATLPFDYWNLKLPNPTQRNDILSFTKTKVTELEAASRNICSGKILSINKTKTENSINIPLEFSSDFWEAEVITVGYVKNLLERILEFLDKITWWLEKKLIKLWQFLKSLFTDYC